MLPMVDCVRTLTRREWARLAACATLLVANGAKAYAASLKWDTPARCGSDAERRYRVDAQVVLLSVPLVRRAGVGSATAVWRESNANQGTTRVLEFAAYSLPDRAAGLNRLGFMQERIRLAESGIAEAIYFGLMTASGEENAEEARGALHSTTSQLSYTAVEAQIQSHSMNTATAYFTASSALSAGHRAELEQMARQALTTAQRQSVDLSLNGQTPPPFLQAVAELLRQPKRGESRYIYNGSLYRLRLRRSADEKASQHFRARGLASGSVIAITGALQRVDGGKQIAFLLWVEQSVKHPLPLRIEFQPKSYLRLRFEAEA
jgi:hypothetical protein